jgi:hypothetical protein
MATMPQFTFTFFRFTGPENARKTERVREFNDADGMRGLIDRNPKLIEAAHEKVIDWVSAKGVAVTCHEPFPSEKYPGKVWLEYRFGGLTL